MPWKQQCLPGIVRIISCRQNTSHNISGGTQQSRFLHCLDYDLSKSSRTLPARQFLLPPSEGLEHVCHKRRDVKPPAKQREPELGFTLQLTCSPPASQGIHQRTRHNSKSRRVVQQRHAQRAISLHLHSKQIAILCKSYTLLSKNDEQKECTNFIPSDTPEAWQEKALPRPAQHNTPSTLS